MSQIDVPGYAMISGGLDNGKYVDAAGKLYRRSGDAMYEVETGDLAAVVAAQQEQEGKVIGESRHSPAGVDEVLAESVKEGQTTEVKAVKPKKGAKPAPVERDVLAVDLIADYSAAEILAMTRSLVENLDKAGVKHDIEPLEGDDEASVRFNAEAIAKYADA